MDGGLLGRLQPWLKQVVLIILRSALIYTLQSDGTQGTAIYYAQLLLLNYLFIFPF